MLILASALTSCSGAVPRTVEVRFSLSTVPAVELAAPAPGAPPVVVKGQGEVPPGG